MIIRLLHSDGSVLVNRLDYPRIPNPDEIIQDERQNPIQRYRVVSIASFTRITRATDIHPSVVVTDVIVQPESESQQAWPEAALTETRSTSADVVDTQISPPEPSASTEVAEPTAEAPKPSRKSRKRN